MGAFIISTGSCIPERLVKNSDLTQFPASAIPLISLKTGVLERHFVAEREKTSDIAFKAAKNALDKVSFPAEKLDAVILASSTSDRIIPATAAKIADMLGAKNAFAFDLNSVCTSGLLGIWVAKSLLLSGYRNILIVAADTYSKILNPKDFSTYPYFGDGAGAVLLSNDMDSALEVLGGIFASDGSGYEMVTVRGGGSETPHNKLTSESDCYFSMKGRDVYEFAISRASECISKLMNSEKISSSEVSQLILHQANINIIKKISEAVGLPMSKCFVNLDKYGNTAGASVLIALDEYLSSGANTGGSIILSAFGGGLTWGAVHIGHL